MLTIASTIIDAKIYIFYSSVENTMILKKNEFFIKSHTSASSYISLEGNSLSPYGYSFNISLENTLDSILLSSRESCIFSVKFT